VIFVRISEMAMNIKYINMSEFRAISSKELEGLGEDDVIIVQRLQFRNDPISVVALISHKKFESSEEN